MSLRRPDLVRVVRDIFVDELSRSRGSRFDPAEAGGWTETTSVRAEGIALDSLERFTLASRLNETFLLYESGVEDNLLRARTLGDTVDIIAAGRKLAGDQLKFYTGGTTGAARILTHEWNDLVAEIRFLADLFPPRKRVIVTVPVHHIYGFLFGVLLPQALDVPAVDAQHSLLSGPRRPAPGDLVVSAPFLWKLLQPQAAGWGNDVVGTTSTAPMPADTARSLTTAGLAALYEIYGSSETAGVGWRTNPDEPFTLFPHWSAGDDPATLVRGERRYQSPDYLTWISPRSFIPRGRRDAVVQVAGKNVDTEELAELIREVVPEVTDCAVRLGNDGRIRALVVPGSTVVDEQGALPNLVVERLSGKVADVAIPGQVIVADSLPRTPVGKIGEF